jgi:hypothetical protein
MEEAFENRSSISFLIAPSGGMNFPCLGFETCAPAIGKILWLLLVGALLLFGPAGSTNARGCCK